MAGKVSTHEMMAAAINLGPTSTGLPSASSAGEISYKARMEAAMIYSVERAM